MTRKAHFDLVPNSPAVPALADHRIEDLDPQDLDKTIREVTVALQRVLPLFNPRLRKDV